MRLTSLLALATLAAATAAQAQGPGGGGLSPEVHAAREAVARTCAADAKALCDGQQGRNMMICLRDHAAKVSAPCKDAMSKMPPRPARPR